MARTKFAPTSTPSVDRSTNPTTCLIPRPVRPMMLNGIRSRSAVFPQCTGQTDRRTDRPTDRSRESLMTTGRCATRATRPNNKTHRQTAIILPPTLRYSRIRHRSTRRSHSYGNYCGNRGVTRIPHYRVSLYSNCKPGERRRWIPYVLAVSERIAFVVDLVVRCNTHSVWHSPVRQLKQFLLICKTGENPQNTTYDNYKTDRLIGNGIHTGRP